MYKWALCDVLIWIFIFLGQNEASIYLLQIICTNWFWENKNRFHFSYSEKVTLKLLSHVSNREYIFHHPPRLTRWKQLKIIIDFILILVNPWWAKRFTNLFIFLSFSSFFSNFLIIFTYLSFFLPNFSCVFLKFFYFVLNFFLNFSILFLQFLFFFIHLSIFSLDFCIFSFSCFYFVFFFIFLTSSSFF